jgi:hypothetical protein
MHNDIVFLRYAIVENLRYMLSAYNTSDPMYFGCRFKPYVKQGYMSGGAGYVLSREALKRFIEQAVPDKTKCRQDHGGAEDVEMGELCFHAVHRTVAVNREFISLSKVQCGTKVAVQFHVRL